LLTQYNIIKDHFDQIASIYNDKNELTPSSHIFITRINRVIELIEKLDWHDELHVLSVGCGPSMEAGYFLNKGCQYYGIDLSEHMLHEARKRHKDETIFLTQGNMTTLPFRDATFDILLCLGSLEYIDNKNVVVSELYRVMNNNAVVIISMENRFSIYRLWDHHIYRGLLFNFIRKLIGRHIIDKPLEKPESLNDFRNMLLNQSLSVLDHLYYNYNIWVKPFDRLFPKLSVLTSESLECFYRHSIGIFSADFIIEARKINNIA